MRRLPLESFTELARQLLEDPEVFVLITGVDSEKPDAQSLCAQLESPRALDLTGRTTMTELLHLFDLAHVLVTNDSGPAHFAALTRIHVVVFFGPEIPERYRPLTTQRGRDPHADTPAAPASVRTISGSRPATTICA